jgi:hypothetical protein
MQKPRSCGVSAWAMAVVQPPASRLAWLWTTPFGRPVVPEVYISSAWSPGAMAVQRPVGRAVHGSAVTPVSLAVRTGPAQSGWTKAKRASEWLERKGDRVAPGGEVDHGRAEAAGERGIKRHDAVAAIGR